jgi:hypothetical protein
MSDDDLAAVEAALSDEDRALLDELAEAIARRRLTSAAMFFLESVKPMGYVGSQMMIFLRPMISVVWSNPARWDQLQQILERRGSIELLLRRLEARA